MGIRALKAGTVLALGALIFSVFLFLASRGHVPRLVLTSAVDRASDGRYTPSALSTSADEVMLVYVSSPTCVWCAAKELPPLIEEAKIALHKDATARGYSFATFGMAQSATVQDGVRHLYRFGQFDEIAAGRGWLNSGLQRYIYSQFPGRPATPQVVIVRRTLDISTAGRFVVSEEVLERYIGLNAIADWVKAGPTARIPHDVRR